MPLAIRPEAARRSLLQTFRAFQAIAETGVTIHLPGSETALWDHAALWFPYSYRADDDRASSLPVQIDHEEPNVSIGSLKRPLLFPHRAFELYRQSWTSRTLFSSFAGNPSRVRKKVLKRWSRSHRRAVGRAVSLSWSQEGRRWPGKAWDPNYVADLGRSQFVLCPRGDFSWTYRFFEAAACGAIPIVEESHSLYEGFHHHRIDEQLANLEWSNTRAEENYQLARGLLTIELDELTSQITKLVGKPTD